MVLGSMLRSAAWVDICFLGVIALPFPTCLFVLAICSRLEMRQLGRLLRPAASVEYFNSLELMHCLSVPHTHRIFISLFSGVLPAKISLGGVL